MVEGLFGTFPFTVTEDMVTTFSGVKRTREAVYAEHQVLSGLPKLQYMGRSLDNLSLTINITPVLGNPSMTVDLKISMLRVMLLTGIAYPLVLGLTYFGLFVIKSVEVEHTEIQHGATLQATINLTLQEYN